MPHKWKVLLTVAFGIFIAATDFSVLTIALPHLSEDFQRPPHTVVWVVLGPALLSTALTLSAGRVGDTYGRKRVYLAGWVIFTVATLFAGFSSNIWQLIAARVVQAVGVALSMANGNAIITDVFPEAERARAVGPIGAVVGAGVAAGSLVGALIVHFLSWQAIFYLTLPPALAAMLLALFFVPESRSEIAIRRPDVAGSLAIFTALGSLFIAANRGEMWGWTAPSTLALIAIGAIAVLALLAIESRSPSPVVHPALLKTRSFSFSFSSLALNLTGQGALTFLLPLYLMTVRGFSAMHTGLVVITIPAIVLALSHHSGYVADRFAFRYQSTIGLALVSVGLLSLATLHTGSSLLSVIVRLAIVGIGAAISLSPTSSAIMGSVHRQMLGTASATVLTARNVGSALGLAVSSTLLVAVASRESSLKGLSASEIPAQDLLLALRVCFVVAAVFPALGIITAVCRGPLTRAPLPASIPPATCASRE